MIPTARRQRIAEALAAYDAAGRRVRLLLGIRPVSHVDLQALANTFATVHGDTPEVQATRREVLARDAAAYDVGRPRLAGRSA